MPIKSLFGRTYQVVERALEVTKSRHGVIASNIANVDTQGYKTKELNFDKALDNALDKGSVEVRRTNPLHFGRQNLGAGSFETSKASYSGVDIDKEMSKLAENNLRFQTGVEALLRKFSALKYAITEGGR